MQLAYIRITLSSFLPCRFATLTAWYYFISDAHLQPSS